MTLRLTPSGQLLLEAGEGRLATAFERGSGPGLLHLGAAEAGRSLPPVLVWWRDFAARYVVALCHQDSPRIPPPSGAELASLVLTAPMMAGAEYLSADVLRHLWDDIAKAVEAAAGADLQAFLKGLNPAWNLVGRVHFNLAENRRDPDFPFAFMATYTSRLSAAARAQHVPLGQALREYAGDRDKLLNLLLPVSRAAESCLWLKTMVEAGEIYHPLRWSPSEAARLLESVPDLEAAGLVVRMPAAWGAPRPPRPKVTATIGTRPPSALGLDGLLDFRMEVTLAGEALDDSELCTLLAGTESLVLLRGQWVEVDRSSLDRQMRRFREAEDLARRGGLSFAEAMRMLAGATIAEDGPPTDSASWSAGRRRPLAGRDATRIAVPRRDRRSSLSEVEGDLAPLSAGGGGVAAPAVGTGAGRLPCRRHGTGQDHPGAWRCCWAQQGPSGQACWWPPLRCWPIGRPKSNASLPSLRPASSIPRRWRRIR